ncbi:MAG: RpiB/LacA/LacB family sugar-phosphate isomerase [Patescibacteria group bacterium]
MKIYLGADHRGFLLKESLEKYLTSRSYDVDDQGDQKLDPDDDFPVFASRVVAKMLSSDDPDPRGILFCSSGQGMAMMANRFKGIRAAVIWNVDEARAARNDDDSNVLALPAHLFEDDRQAMQDIVETWLKTPFDSAARRIRRIKEMDEL